MKSQTKSALGTKKFGREVAEKICPQRKAMILGLRGELGSGKTTFVQGFAKGLGVKDKILSPTFVILKKFEIPKNKKHIAFRNFYHIDCYRLNKGKDLLDLDFAEIADNPENIVLIEWPERVKSALPRGTMFLSFKFVNMNTREIKYGVDVKHLHTSTHPSMYPIKI